MLNKKQIAQLREELATAKNPLFFYANKNVLDSIFPRKLEELDPDKIFILDIPVFTQELADKAKRPIFWIDHHPPIKLKKVNYYNPLIKKPNSYIPTSRMCWQISRNPADLWIATVGCLADWHLPNFIDEFIEHYPDLIPKKTTLPKMVFKDPISKLIKFFFLIQNGSSNDVRKSINVLKKIKDPDEILKQTTSQGKYLWKRFQVVNKMYEELLKEVKVTRSKLLLFYYTENKWSFTANLANELMAKYPKKVILIARKKGDEYKCSFRGKDVATALQTALENINGRGGGHPDAAGATVKEQDWDKFLEQFKVAIK